MERQRDEMKRQRDRQRDRQNGKTKRQNGEAKRVYATGRPRDEREVDNTERSREKTFCLITSIFDLFPLAGTLTRALSYRIETKVETDKLKGKETKVETDELKGKETKIETDKIKGKETKIVDSRSELWKAF